MSLLRCYKPTKYSVQHHWTFPSDTAAPTHVWRSGGGIDWWAPGTSPASQPNAQAPLSFYHREPYHLFSCRDPVTFEHLDSSHILSQSASHLYNPDLLPCTHTIRARAPDD
ncbi:uncharacterized protein CLUP02_14983 [Colletotrichum lupini]|uniref:Uncharacterized protein n=1 Tax=Colletotrichum lupini TaxID=145971 RepID=A0A9Q8WNK4_9PEZI|nr:uncharacterized protein CLUP02_14983 [Colletotrichum lupini]UQC89452.1 hypothetical protein CLUP02_14983 [Colletotrichum lupini]